MQSPVGIIILFLMINAFHRKPGNAKIRELLVLALKIDHEASPLTTVYSRIFTHGLRPNFIPGNYNTQFITQDLSSVHPNQY